MTIPYDKQFNQETDPTYATTADIVVLKGTTAATGTSEPVHLPKGAGPFVFQINDSNTSATVSIEGSVDQVNYSEIASYATGAVVVPPPMYIPPFIRVVWSGNTGTLAVLAYSSH